MFGHSRSIIVTRASPHPPFGHLPPINGEKKAAASPLVFSLLTRPHDPPHQNRPLHFLRAVLCCGGGYAFFGGRGFCRNRPAAPAISKAHCLGDRAHGNRDGRDVALPAFSPARGRVARPVPARRAARQYLYGDGRHSVWRWREQPRRALDPRRATIPAHCNYLLGDAA